MITNRLNNAPALPTDIAKPIKDLIHLFMSNLILQFEKLLSCPPVSLLTLDKNVNGDVVLAAFHVVSLTRVLLALKREGQWLVAHYEKCRTALQGLRHLALAPPFVHCSLSLSLVVG